MKKICAFLLTAVCLTACFRPLPTIPTLPDMQLPVAGTEAVWKAADYTGKPVMLVFMGSWCPYCKMTMPAVMQAAKEFGGQVEIVGVFVDEDPNAVKAVIKEHNFTVKSLYNGGEVIQMMEVQGFPHTVLFDKKHRAVKRWEGFSPTRLDDYREALANVTR